MLTLMTPFLYRYLGLLLACSTVSSWGLDLQIHVPYPSLIGRNHILHRGCTITSSFQMTLDHSVRYT